MYRLSKMQIYSNFESFKDNQPSLTLEVVEPALEIMERIEPWSLGEDLQPLVLVFQTSTFMCSLRHVGDRPEPHQEKGTNYNTLFKVNLMKTRSRII